MTASLLEKIRTADLLERTGRVRQVSGLLIEASGPPVFLGERCEIRADGMAPLSAEVVAIREDRMLLMAHGDLRGVRRGAPVLTCGAPARVPVGTELLGRVLDPFGNPLDDRPAPRCTQFRELFAEPLNPLRRPPIERALETGVKSIDTLLTIGRGQRIGIFSGSGVGKSTLLGMIARNVASDINVIALIGERGREVLEFIGKNLGEAGLQRSVVIAATSDQPALLRAHAALAASAVAEFFRDEGADVLLTMDSVTRFAMAQREIGLAVGEVPTARGYTPSVFALLPRLLERAGTGPGGGSITALYTVLVEGDDMNEPVADHVRAIVDGHIVLSRKLAHEVWFPAIDILQSNSRLANGLRDAQQRATAQRAQRCLSLYHSSRDMLDLGAYQAGANPELDEAIAVMPKLRAFLCQDEHESCGAAQSFAELAALWQNAPRQ